MSLIQCHFDYASPVWFNGLTKNLKSQLQVTQNKLIRFVLNLEPRSHIGNDDFIKLYWLPVSYRVDQVTLCHVFKMHNNLAPKYMSEHFSPASNAHSYITRFRVSEVFMVCLLQTQRQTLNFAILVNSFNFALQ